MPQNGRILITGAAGRFGSERRKGLAPLAEVIRLADRQPIGTLAPKGIPDPKAAAAKHLDGRFCELGHPDDEVAK